MPHQRDERDSAKLIRRKFWTKFADTSAIPKAQKPVEIHLSDDITTATFCSICYKRLPLASRLKVMGLYPARCKIIMNAAREDAIDSSAVNGKLASTLRHTLDRKYQGLFRSAQAGWERYFAGSDPSDSCVTIRISAGAGRDQRDSFPPTLGYAA